MIQPPSPAAEWLAARLAQGPAAAQEVTDDALTLGITEAELFAARQELGVKVGARTPAAGGAPYKTWELPKAVPGQFKKGYDPNRFHSKPLPAVVPAAAVIVVKKADPKARVEAARRRAQRHAVRAVRVIEELTETVVRDGVKCPTCGRGSRRAEDIRLRAATTLLDKAGVVTPKDGLVEGSTGPVLVFPEGTKMAVLAQAPEDHAQ